MSGAIQGHPGTSKDIQGHLGTSRDIQGHPGTSRDIKGHPGTSRDIQGRPGTSRDIWGHPGTSIDIECVLPLQWKCCGSQEMSCSKPVKFRLATDCSGTDAPVYAAQHLRVVRKGWRILDKGGPDQGRKSCLFPNLLCCWVLVLNSQRRASFSSSSSRVPLPPPPPPPPAPSSTCPCPSLTLEPHIRSST